MLSKELGQFKTRAKSFAIDTGANFAYWQPLLAAYEYFLLGYSGEEVMTARTGNIALALVLGRPFGMAIDFGRRHMIPGYKAGNDNGTLTFREMFSTAHRKQTLMTIGVDTFTTSVFWNVVMLPWLANSKSILDTFGVSDMSSKIGLSGTQFTPEQLLHAGIAYTALYLVAGAPYGKFLDFFRKRFGNTE